MASHQTTSTPRQPSLLRTALSPRWLAGLALAAIIAGAFGFLANWQWSRSHEAPPPAPSITEKVKPLQQIYQPGRALLGSEADHIVSVEGAFDASKQVLIGSRLQSGDRGYWTVSALRVTNTDTWIPIVRGWSADKKIADGLPTGTVTVVGRLLPPEAPFAGQEPEEGAFSNLSPAQLTNVWDASLYDAFIVSNDKIPADAPATLERVPVEAQPQKSPVNWLNIFYAIEWIVFAGAAFYMWFRLVKDDYERQLEDEAYTADLAARETRDADSTGPDPAHDSDPATDSEEHA